MRTASRALIAILVALLGTACATDTGDQIDTGDPWGAHIDRHTWHGDIDGIECIVYTYQGGISCDWDAAR